MTATVRPLSELASLRRTLAASLATRALLVGAAVSLTAFTLATLLSRLMPASSLGTSGVHVALAITLGLATALAVRWRAGRITDTRVALWVEERVTGLDYALVTAADERHAALRPALAPRLGSVPWSVLARRAAARATVVPFAAAAVAALLLLLVLRPPAALAPALGASGSGTGAASRAPGAIELEVRRAVVRPPSYTGQSATTLRTPSSVAGLAGSTIELSGRATAEARATLDVRGDDAPQPPRTLPMATTDGDWSARFTMPDDPAVVRVTAGGVDRLVLLEPRPDSAPEVAFAASVRDTVLREPRGAIALAATARDDIGLVSSGFEWIVSSGEGESYTFRSGVLGAAQHGGARSAELRATLALDALELGPGDVIHLRAVARDGNTRSGPGLGASETRTVRIARAGEYDSLAVEAAPPAAMDTAALSQRMILMQTERLESRRPRMERPAVVSEARTIAVDQTRLRKRVGEIVFARLGDEVGGEHSHFPGDGHEHGPEVKLDPEQLLARAAAATDIQTGATDFHGDETPVVAINKPLLEAYNHMWDASRALEVGEPAQAIPPMRRALEALQRARTAERIYLRGRPPAVVVDVASARLAGKESGTDGVRRPRAPLDGAAAERLRRLDEALLLRRRDAAAAADSLQLLRADALRAAPALAAALGEAVDALRAGRDAAEPLARARRLAAGAPAASGGLPRWGGLP